MAEKMDGQDYKRLTDHIDLRYKIMYGHLNYTATSKDDPMGLALVEAREGPEVQQPDPEMLAAGGGAAPGRDEQQWDNSLDAVAKGKGKGKGGVCHTCGGQGHFARDCATVLPLSPQSTECHGCGVVGI